MAAPVDPFPNFVPAALADGDQVDARFAALYTALDRSKPSGGLDAASIKDGILVQGLTVMDAWQSVSLVFGGSLEFYKDLLSMVHFKPKTFPLPVATYPAGTVLATLPAGFRPGVTSVIHFMQVLSASGLGAGHLYLNTAGQLSVGAADGSFGAGGSGQSIQFNAEPYRAEN